MNSYWKYFRFALLGVLLSTDAVAQRYPEKLITFVVPYAAGATTDLGARVLARAISDDAKQPVIIENRPGVDGLVGVQAVARATPDGYTVLLSTSSTHVLNPHLYKTLPYDPVKDFIPVAMLYRGIQILVVSGNSSLNTLHDLIERAKQNPGKLTFGASTATTRLAIEMFKQLSGTEILYVPYKGVPLFLTDIMNGTIDLGSADVSTLKPLIDAGKLRALGVSSKTRHYMLPQVPTLDESGLKEYEFTYWGGIWLPAGTPAGVVTRLHDLAYGAVKAPPMTKFIRDGGGEIVELSVKELATLQSAEIERYGRVIRGAGIQPQ